MGCSHMRSRNCYAIVLSLLIFGFDNLLTQGGDKIGIDTVTNYDRNRSVQVRLVVRVRILGQLGGSKYQWVRVRVIEIVKNTTGKSIPKGLDISFVQTRRLDRNPFGTECTLYLVPFSDRPNSPWTLLGNSV